MEAIQHTFKRVEKKYVITGEQEGALLRRLEPYMRMDEYGRHTVLNIYFDTEDYALIRESVEKPVYKEKFRLRAYSTSGEEDVVFAELKKKYKGVVYKRRIAACAWEIDRVIGGETIPGEDVQTQREMHWFFGMYRPKPRVFIGYDRFALIGREDENLRVTFDHDIRWRQERLSLASGADGEPVLGDNPIVMEIKIPGAAPFWLARLLSEMRIFPTSFSKYGACYLTHIASNFLTNGGIHHA